MSDYINKSKLYEEVARLEELAENKFLKADIGSHSYELEKKKLDEISHLKHFLLEFETEDVAPVKHSKWVGYTTGAFHGIDGFSDPIYRDVTVYRCDNCSRRTVVKENYCPRCGARMDLK